MAPPTATETLVETITQAPTVVPILAETQDVEASPKIEAPPRVDSPIELVAPVETGNRAEAEPEQAKAAAAAEKPKVRRIIDEEGGTTTATVCTPRPLTQHLLIITSTQTTFQFGTMAKSTHHGKHSSILSMARMQTRALRNCFPKARKSVI